MPPRGGHAIRRASAAVFTIALGLVSPTLPGTADPGAQQAVPPAGEVYGWQDDQGVVRYTSHLDRVPASARERTVRIFRDGGTGVALLLPLRDERLVARAETDGGREITAALPARPATPDEPGAPELPPVAAAGPAGSWAIQLEATEVSSWLRPLDTLALLEGRRLYRTPCEVEGQAWERLRLGFFPSLDAARQAVARLQPHFPGAWVDAADASEQATSARQAIEAPARFRTGPVAAASGEPVYVIQLSARPVDDRLRVLTRLELLERHRLYRHTVESRGAVWERLRLGDFPSFEAAHAVLRELRSSYPDAWIDRAES